MGKRTSNQKSEPCNYWLEKQETNKEVILMNFWYAFKVGEQEHADTGFQRRKEPDVKWKYCDGVSDKWGIGN